jgi:predicted DNA-binding ribbon-helix-helix protein
MGSFYRTQVLLEHQHYAALKQLAKEEGVSLSALLRRILDEYLQDGRESTQRVSLTELAGLGRDQQLSGSDHDRALYGATA